MNDGDAMRQVVFANPDDDTARLVYADWLEEDGKGEHAQLMRSPVGKVVVSFQAQLPQLAERMKAATAPACEAIGELSRCLTASLDALRPAFAVIVAEAASRRQAEMVAAPSSAEE